ncbi:hypothetical protein Bcenmc03_0018 [Burkholderia orbicola MC0-3]|uniref:TniQ protein n=1 Tax=Burkholderia orbicola (strain MC0-3) TaxID=406425 RepID=B1K1B1_BURO0|nr:hypothetical protein Bcenmc03_0018 [Burkholderia orbicola MC0-3]
MNLKPIHNAGWRSRGIALFAGRFLVRPMACSDESFLGYRLRVAFANGLSNPGWLDCRDCSLPKAHGIARWCPHCLADAGCYWREDWYSGPAACLTHRCWLTSVCAACRRTLRWKQVRFAICTCGAPLREAAVDKFSAEVLKLIGEQITSSAASLSVGERWNLARFLGALSQFGLQGKPLKRASRRKENIEQLLVTAGASLIVDRSASFELLDRLRAPQADMNNVPLFSEVFPHLLTMLRKQLSKEEHRWMLNMLDAYISNSSRQGSAVLWERRSDARGTNTELRSRQKTRNSAVTNMLAQTGEIVPVRRTPAGRQKFAISADNLKRLRNTQRSLVPLKTAVRYAGMSTRRIQALAKAGLLASHETRIDTRSVDRFLNDITAVCARDGPAIEDPISLAEALRLYVPVEASAAFFNHLANGAMRLAVDRGKQPTLRNIFADRDDVISAAQIPVESDSPISIVEAARRLGVKQEVMYHLINIGLVKTRTAKLRRRAAQAVDVDELKKFAEQFQPLRTVASAIGISAREAPGWARQHGIEIVTGPSVDGGRQYWIRTQTTTGSSRSVGSEA